MQLCKKYGTYSLVDGAHSIGQHKVDMTIAQCDFFVTVSQSLISVEAISGLTVQNCHKWLMACVLPNLHQAR